MPPGHPLIIAHRGGVAERPGLVENSIEAFEAAIADGIEVVELDVRRTSEGELIVFHDEHAGSEPVSALTRQEVGERAGHLPAPLSAVVATTAGRVRLDVELKESGYVAEALELVGSGHDPATLIVTSFIEAVVAEAKLLLPEARVGLLLGRGRPRDPVRTRLRELYPIRRALAANADFLAPHETLARLGVSRRAAAAGRGSMPWTVNDDEAIRRLLADPRVEGVITDRPRAAMALRTDLAPR